MSESVLRSQDMKNLCDSLFILEGATDVSAALTIGVQFCVGLPSCGGGAHHVMGVIKRRRFSNAIIVADNDEPGLRGAKMLQGHLAMPSAIVVLPCKDMRLFLNLGGTLEDLNCIVSGLAWQQPK